ncbi:LysR family transcriptional regulator [Marinicauda pacifica]|jgi:DNA-binding transcriptional LysR family regulator|uniref:LysR family transcriptional regulator n=1 Tax=Marinicauda pacifica TaxID=1133559 RepID=UPI0035C7BB23
MTLDWDKLKTFHAAAEAGSLTRASDALHLSQSAVSRQISALEAELGVKLFHRHARGLLTTEPGRLLFEATRDIAAKVAFAEAQVQDSRDEPTGLLRVTAPTALGALWLAPRLYRFRALYPLIKLRLLLADHELDIANLEADVAIRPWGSTQNDLIQRKLMDVDQHLYASPAYLDRAGLPASIEALDRHDMVAYGPRHLAPIPNLNWHLVLGREKGAKPREAVIEANTINAIMKTAEAGLGIAGLPDYVARENENLVRVLPDIDGPAFETFFVYPEELKGSRRVIAFREFLIEEVKRWEQ